MNAFYCSRCRARFAAGGDCPTCPDETLLNLRDPDVHDFLMEEDGRKRSRRFAAMAGTAIPGALAAYGLFFTLMDLAGPFRHAASGVLSIVFGVIVVASVAVIVTLKRRPIDRVYPQLHPQELAELLPDSTRAPRKVRPTLKHVPALAELLGDPARTRKRIGGRVAKVCVIRVTAVTTSSRGGGTGTSSTFQSFLVDTGGEVHDLEEGGDGGEVVMRATSLAQILDVPFEDARYGG